MKFLLVAFFCVSSNIISTIGSSSPKLEGKIINGRLVPVNQKVPGADLTSVVSVRYRGEHHCGGCLISEYHVLTAAHCLVFHLGELDSIDVFKVYVGSVFLLVKGEEYSVRHKDTHPQYQNLTQGYAFDIGLLTLRTMVTKPAHVKPAVLPPPNILLRSDAIGVFAGWGSWKVDGPVSKFMRNVQLRIAPNKYCDNGIHDYNDKVQFCTFSKSSEYLVEEDFGSPLLHQNILLGINSCSNNKGSATFNKISGLLAYIDEAKKRAEVEDSTANAEVNKAKDEANNADCAADNGNIEADDANIKANNENIKADKAKIEAGMVAPSVRSPQKMVKTNFVDHLKDICSSFLSDTDSDFVYFKNKF